MHMLLTTHMWACLPSMLQRRTRPEFCAVYILDRAHQHFMPMTLSATEQTRTKELTKKLVAMLDPFVRGDKEGFKNHNVAEAERLSEASFGEAMLTTVGCAASPDLILAVAGRLPVSGTLPSGSQQTRRQDGDLAKQQPCLFTGPDWSSTTWRLKSSHHIVDRGSCPTPYILPSNYMILWGSIPAAWSGRATHRISSCYHCAPTVLHPSVLMTTWKRCITSPQAYCYVAAGMSTSAAGACTEARSPWSAS